jgi:phosphoribosylanthranilate isomerase
MVAGIQLKVCGLTSLVDADSADASGADYLGFNFYPKSPRHIAIGQYRAMHARLPDRRRVAVVVEPTEAELLALRDAGLERFQVHFRHDLPPATVEGWSSAVGPANLWLAPKLPPGADVQASWTQLAGALLLDTFDEKLFGGTGRAGDWPKFRRSRDKFPGTTWILSGGLNPANVGDALAGSGARFLDVNSGVESAPGVKDEAKLKAFAAAVRTAAGG